MRLLVLAALAFSLIAVSRESPAQPMLQPNVTVTGDTIHLGDLFSDAGTHAQDPIAAAPAIGLRMTFSASWLGSVAREHHLDWAPRSDYDQANVERATRVIGADTVAQHILAAIAASGPGDASLQLDNPGLRFIVPAEASDTMSLDGLSVDPRSGRFAVAVAAPADSATAQRQRVTGRVIYQTTVAVPTRGIAIGDILGPNDVSTVKLPRERLAADAITDPQTAIGKAARRILRAGESLRAGDIQEPVVVHKGDLVTIELSTPAMQLTAQGKALDDGGQGASIRIANTRSKRVIDATVAGPNRVVIGGERRDLAARS